MTRILSLDVGTSSVRAQVFAENGAADDLSQEAYDSADPDEVVALTRRLIGDRLEKVDAVGAACFGHSLLAVDERGRPLTPILGWRDTRSADAADWLARRLDAEALHARTGCHVHTSYWPAKLAWLAEEEPDVFRRTGRFLSFCDYLYEGLLGRPAPTSVSIASGTGLLDLHSRSWDDELLATLGLDAERLPAISDNQLEGWYPALLDGACSNLGVGCAGRTQAALMVGTSGALRTLYETEMPQPRAGLFLYRLDDSRVVEGGALSDGGNLSSWLRHSLQEAGGSLAERDPDSHGLTFLTLLGGERSPGWHLRAKGAVLGLTFETTPLDLRQAALEGVAFRFAEVVELMPEVEEIVATGGALVHDEDWVQIMADALGRPVTTSKVEEASLRGAAVATLERLGSSLAEAPRGRVVEPRQDRADAYRAARERQRELYRAATATDTS